MKKKMRKATHETTRTTAAAGSRCGKRISALALTALLVLSLAACGADGRTKSTLLNAEPGSAGVDTAADLQSAQNCIRDFSLDLFRRAGNTGENFVMSPLSAATALAMTGQGAGGETAAQIEAVLGNAGETGSLDSCAQWLKEYQETILQPQEGVEVSCANAVWLRDTGRLQVSEDYLQRVRYFFDADVYKAPFDPQTVKEINKWCSQKTDGRIQGMLQEIQDSDVFYLLNAIAFDGKWETPYEKDELWEETFTCETGQASEDPGHSDGGTDPAPAREVSMMHSTEWGYLTGAHAVGVMKPYKSGFSFVGILPEAGMPMKEFLASFDGDAWTELLESRTETAVVCGIPEFRTDSSMSLKDTLQDMGVTDLFDAERADLRDLAVSQAGNIWIANALQRTVIEVDRHGTKAASISLFSGNDAAGPMETEVILNRPFIYAVVDDQSHLPVFLGVMMDPQA